MDKKFLVESKSFAFSVLAEGGGEEEIFFGSGHIEFSELRMACVDVGSVVGFTGRARNCKVIQRGIETFDCSKRWEQRWALFRGFLIRVGWLERVHCYPRGSWRVELDQIL